MTPEQAESFAREAVFASTSWRAARHGIRLMARQQGARPASIRDLYARRARGEVGGFTIPAVNVRGLTFDVARALFRAMHATEGIAIFELNRAEMTFTAQSPDEFAAVVLAAALAEGWRGPVYLQGDHLMANAAAYGADPAKEIAELERIVRECITAGFFCIDIDASTLVDLSFATVPEQQRVNAELTARLVGVVRSCEQAGVSVSIGGEIGEVGGHNSTEEELRAYVEQVEALAGPRQLAKVSVQTGTKHGGFVLPDGSTASVALDFGTLERLGAVAREYGMAGAVQHGASTLPDDLFGRFPAVECAEVHLATGFQDLVIDHPAFPPGLRKEIHAWTVRELDGERGADETDAQFLRKARRKAWGPFKRQAWDIPAEAREEIGRSLEGRFVRTIESLNAVGTLRFVKD